jgi:hypothetical protein
MRDYADWVAHLANSLKRHPRQPVDLPLHAASRLQVTFRPPAGPIDDDLVIRVAKRVAFEFSVWHEIATWYGWRQVPIYPEAVSAFSPEDLYSNLLGATIGERALRAYLNADAGADYSTLVQRETRALLTELGEVSQSETERLLDTIEGEDGWWDRTQGVPRFKGVTRRHLDLGETVVPWLVPGSREAPTPLTVGSLGAEGRPLGDFYTLQVEVDKSAVPALTLHSGPTIKSTEFKGIVERLRKDVLHRLGPMADSPDRVHTVTFSADRRIRAFRPTQSSWQVRVEELSGGDWRPSYQRSFVTLTDLGRYLSRTPEGRRLLSKLKAE